MSDPSRANAPVQAWWANARRASPAPPNPPAVACNRLLGDLSPSSTLAVLPTECKPQAINGTCEVSMKHGNVLDLHPQASKLLFNWSPFSSTMRCPREPLDNALDLPALHVEISEVHGNRTVGLWHSDPKPGYQTLKTRLNPDELGAPLRLLPSELRSRVSLLF